MVQSTHGAVQSCANDHAVLRYIRCKMYTTSNELCSRGNERNPSIVARSVDDGSNQRSEAVLRGAQGATPPPPRAVVPAPPLKLVAR